jgi:hypothetical protein
MDGSDLSLIRLLQGHQLFVIPPYQRSYEWDSMNWQTLIQDIMNVSTRPDTYPAHWMGIFLTTAGKPIPGTLSEQKLVVDGQQRLVTLRIWLAALEHAASDEEDPLELFDYAEILVQDSDKPSYQAALAGDWRNPIWRGHLERGPLGAYAYFRWVLWLGEITCYLMSQLSSPSFDIHQRHLRENGSDIARERTYIKELSLICVCCVMLRSSAYQSTH